MSTLYSPNVLIENIHLVMIFLFFCLLIFFSAAMGFTVWPVPTGGVLTGGAPQPPSLACLRVLLPEQDMGKLEELMNTMYLLELDITPDLVVLAVVAPAVLAPAQASLLRLRCERELAPRRNLV
jgi:hypothetical protein